MLSYTKKRNLRIKIDQACDEKTSQLLKKTRFYEDYEVIKSF